MKNNIFNNLVASTSQGNGFSSLVETATSAVGQAYSPMQDLKKMYGQARALGVLLQCMYIVTIDDIYGIGHGIPWFTDKTLSFLVTEADLSLGSAEAESFYAGALPASLLTQKNADDMELTFIETSRGDVFKSFRACYNLAFNADGTVNEPRKYSFKLTVGLFNHEKPKDPPAVTRSWIVAAKSGRTEASASARSEIVKESITFQKVRPLFFER